MLNRCVTSHYTKVTYDGLDWLLAGREFSTVGTVQQKDRMEILDSMYGTASSGSRCKIGILGQKPEVEIWRPKNI